jgi:glucokinase
VPAVRVGVDIGGTKIAIVLIDADHRVVDSARTATPPADGIVDVVASVVSELGAGGYPIGIGAAGLVTPEGVVRAAPNLSGVNDLALSALIEQRCGVRCVVDNDNTCAALGEWKLGAGRGSDHLVYVGLGTGIGGGLVMDGALRRGAHGFAGEIGHMVVAPDGPPCPCGRRGCWERLASGSALVPLASAHGMTAERGEDVIGAARAGSVIALGVLEEFSRWIALGLANLTNLCDPDRIVIGGGLSDDADLIAPLVAMHFVELLVAPGLRPYPELRFAELGSASAAIGAALLLDGS